MQLNADKESYISPSEQIGYYRVLNKLQQAGLLDQQDIEHLMLKAGLVWLENGTYRDRLGRVFKMI